jgi:peptidyl-prolyl cis-trans isomerase D
MLQQIRERAQGWIAWFIVILISIPFALWGIQEYLGVGSERAVATVNGQEITEREFERGYREFRQRLRQQLGANYRPELFDEARLREEVLNSMIRNQLILQSAADMGLSAGDDLVRAMIVSIPAFSIAGRFDQQAYERGVRSRGLTPAGFEDQMRRALVSEQLSKAIVASEFTTDEELKQQIALTRQQRELQYVKVESKPFLAGAEVSENEIRDYYASNQDRFIAPERVKVEYLDLQIDNISKTLTADEESLLGFYEQQKHEYITPEQRRASHILITVEEGADAQAADAARQAADAALERIRAGEDFAVVAREVSQDPGSSDQGGDLGFFEKGVMDQAFEDAVFGMQTDDVSEPVRSSFGFHVIKLTAIRPAQGKSYEEAKEEIRQAFLKSEAERLFYEYAERLSDLAYEDPDSLQPAAEALGMTTLTSDWLGREGGAADLFAAPKVVGAAFSDDVLIEGHNSEAIEIGPERMVVLRVIEHEEAAVRPFDDVQAEIEEKLKLEKAGEMARKRGEELLGRLKQGESLQSLADADALTVVSSGLVSRNDRVLPPALLQRLFKMPRPTGDDSQYDGTVLANGDYAIIALGAVKDGVLGQDDKENENALKNLQERSRGTAYFNHFIENQRKNAEIVITRQEQQ